MTVMRGACLLIPSRALDSALAISPRIHRRPSRGLGERRFHDLAGDRGDLDVHLKRRDSEFGSRHLEVHVAQVVFVAEDVGEHGDTVVLVDQAHGDSGDGCFMGTPASINASEAPHTVAIEDEPFDSVISETTRMV